MTTVYERIYKAGKEKGILPNDVARDLGFSTGYPSAWKGQKRVSRNDNAERIANYLGCSAEYISGQTEMLEDEFGGSTTDSTERESKNTSDVGHIIERIYAIQDPNKRAKLIRLIEAIIDFNET